jgi:hypothetical protein
VIDMKLPGTYPLVLGILALIYVGVGYSRSQTVRDLGPIGAGAPGLSPITAAVAALITLTCALPRRRLAPARAYRTAGGTP